MTENTQIGIINQKMEDLKEAVTNGFTGVNAQLQDIKENYVTKHEFWPVRAIVYGAVSSILLAFLGYLISITLK